MLIGGSIFFFGLLVLMHYHDPKVGIRSIAFLGISTGFFVYFIYIIAVRNLFSKDYCMDLNDNEITITSGMNSISVNYTDIQKLIIWNNGDYAKIRIITPKKKYTYHIGNANLKFSKVYRVKSDFCILESFTEIDAIFSKNGFTKMIDENAKEKAGLNIIEYKCK